MNNYRSADLGADEILANYSTKELSGRISFLQNLSQEKKFLLTLVTNQFSRENFLEVQKGKNYIAKSNDYKAIASFLKENNTQTMYDMGVSLSYNDAYQKDALANTITDHSHLSITPYFSKE